MILADENIDPLFISAIREIPIDIFSIAEHYRGIEDHEVIALSRNPQRIILTEDKDFGDWVFAHHVTGVSVILLRYEYWERTKMVKEVTSLVKEQRENLFGKFTTITPKKTRSRLI